MCFFFFVSGCSEEEGNTKSSILNEEYVLALSQNIKNLERSHFLMKEEINKYNELKEEFESGKEPLLALFLDVEENKKNLLGVIDSQNQLSKTSLVNRANIESFSRKYDDKIKSVEKKVIAKDKVDKKKLNVSISRINKWGDSWVAVARIPEVGYKTISENSKVGNGWRVSGINSDTVYFNHLSGAKKVIQL